MSYISILRKVSRKKDCYSSHCWIKPSLGLWPQLVSYVSQERSGVHYLKVRLKCFYISDAPSLYCCRRWECPPRPHTWSSISGSTPEEQVGSLADIRSQGGHYFMTFKLCTTRLPSVSRVQIAKKIYIIRSPESGKWLKDESEWFELSLSSNSTVHLADNDIRFDMGFNNATDRGEQKQKTKKCTEDKKKKDKTTINNSGWLKSATKEFSKELAVLSTGFMIEREPKGKKHFFFNVLSNGMLTRKRRDKNRSLRAEQEIYLPSESRIFQRGSSEFEGRHGPSLASSVGLCKRRDMNMNNVDVAKCECVHVA